MSTQLSSMMDYYYGNMYEDLKALEQNRIRIYGNLKRYAMYICLFCFIFMWILSSLNVMKGFELLVLNVFLGTLVFGFLYRNEVAGFKSLFKDQIIEKIVHFVDKSLQYDKNGKISEDEYTKSMLFTKSYDRYRGDDLVSGMLDKTSIKFSDIHTEYETKDKDGKTHWHTIFQGLFFIADFHKDFNGKTVVLPDFAQRVFGGIGSWMQSLGKSKGKLVKMDDPEFEKEFVVYGEQIESHYILSHSMMERILNFKKKTHKNVYISFIDSKIYVAVDYRKELFEPVIYKSLLEFGQIKGYFEMMEMFVGIVEEFRLNTRVWSKE
ncbi:MAG: DUF3137 domain-containing protein [Sulfurospirillaceae bacterium]|nr:DUF3137 domain-containing protein [Sulfurospirillaceae bacterium]